MTNIVQILREMQQEEDCPMLVHMAFSESVREIERLRVQVSTLESSPLSEEALDILRAENNRLLGLIEEQKGTINALNIAIGGEGSTSTENCVEWYELDPNEEGLISRCRKLMSHIDKLDSRIKEIFTNGDRSMTMDGRVFTAAENGFISDQNFDFDAGLQVSGDFIGNEKQQYAEMIASSLNSLAHK